MHAMAAGLFVGFLVLCLACGGLGGDGKLNASDEAVMLRPAAFAEAAPMPGNVDPELVRCSKMRIFANVTVRCHYPIRGNKEWSYELEISGFPFASDAERGAGMQSSERTTLQGHQGLVPVPAPEISAWGDARDCRHWQNADGVLTGTDCTVIKGNRTVTLQLAGAPIEGEGAFDRLMHDQLQALESWEP